MLGGKPVLVVETEFIIALDLGARLQDLGAGHVVLASDPASAWADRDAWSGAALAVIEVHETRPGLAALAAEIGALGLPVIQVTTDAALLPRTGPAGGLVLLKPVAQDALEAAVAAALGRRVPREWWPGPRNRLGDAP